MYEHAWRVGDALIWDNLATLHARTDFDPKERRALRRTAIRGVRPQAYAGAGAESVVDCVVAGTRKRTAFRLRYSTVILPRWIV